MKLSLFKISQLTTGFFADVVSLTEPDHESKSWIFLSLQTTDVLKFVSFYLKFLCHVVALLWLRSDQVEAQKLLDYDLKKDPVLS